jgi:putative phosphoesterase
VLGNCDTLLSVYEHKIDFELPKTEETKEEKKITIESDLLEFIFFGKKVAVIHGHQPGYLEELIESQLYDLILTGHTHRAGIVRSERTLIVNPGPICGTIGYPRMPAPATFAIYDSKKDIAEIKVIK